MFHNTEIRTLSKNERLLDPEIFLTIYEWDKIYLNHDGWYILDPDGFDRQAPDFYTRKYSEDEFVARRRYCTMGYIK